MIRKLLTATAAIAVVLTCVPAAGAATPAGVLVNGSSTPGSHTANFNLEGGAEIAVGDLLLTCTAAGGSGSVDSGPLSSPFYNDVWMRVTSMTFAACDGAPWGPTDLLQNCDLAITDGASTNVASPMTDLTDIELTIPPGCLEAVDTYWGGVMCRFDIVGSVNGVFDENVTTLGGIDYQLLTIGGTGLTAQNVDFCFGMFYDNDPIELSLTFKVQVPDGLINQVP